MPNPRLPRGAFARLRFGPAIGVVLATLCLAGSAEAHERSPQGWRGGAASRATVRGADVIAEAARWLGRSNPTPFREAWCRDFVNMILERAGYRLADRSHLALRALRLGRRVRDPRPGDLAVMAGHVTFFAGWDGADAFLGLGGNQHHRVTLARFARRAVIAFVRPARWRARAI